MRKKKPNGKKNPPVRLTRAEAEVRKLRLMRQTDAAANSKYNIGGIEKTRRYKPKPPTLPSRETLKKLDENREDD